MAGPKCHKWAEADKLPRVKYESLGSVKVTGKRKANLQVAILDIKQGKWDRSIEFCEFVELPEYLVGR
jgi:uncharacterized protein YajQ (UPF0234 family)